MVACGGDLNVIFKGVGGFDRTFFWMWCVGGARVVRGGMGMGSSAGIGCFKLPSHIWHFKLAS